MMLVVFWFPWLIGLLILEVLFFITERRINKFEDENCSEDEDVCLKELDIQTQELLCFRGVIWTMLVAGIPVGQFSGMFTKETFLARMAISILPVIIMYMLNPKELQKCSCGNKRIQNLLIIIYILAIAIWTTLTTNYYQKNVEETEQKVIEQIERYELLYICDMPVTGEVHVKETKLGDRIPYKYIDEFEDIEEGMAPTSYSKSKSMREGEVPYVEIISYYYYREYIDYYTGICWDTSKHRWKEYIFYLPNNIAIKTQ